MRLRPITAESGTFPIGPRHHTISGSATNFPASLWAAMHLVPCISSLIQVLRIPKMSFADLFGRHSSRPHNYFDWQRSPERRPWEILGTYLLPPIMILVLAFVIEELARH